MNKQKYQSVFKNAEGKAIFMKAYEELLNLWDVPYEEMDVDTSFGPTHVITTGTEGAPPLVLMHGIGNSAPSYALQVAKLSKSHRIYSIDTLGDCGKSKVIKYFKNKQEAFEWLTEVLDGLEIEKTDIAGFSMGAFLSMNMAVQKPDRIIHLILLAPGATFVRLNPSFLIKVLLASRSPIFHSYLADKLITPLSSKKGKLMPDELLNLIFIVLKYGNSQSGLIPSVFSDEELKQVQAKTIFMIGDEEFVNNYDSSLKRVNEIKDKGIIKEFEIKVIENAGHMIITDQPEIVSSHILEFLKK